jgi:hypothetical protein
MIHAEITHLRYVLWPSSVLQSHNRQAGRLLNLPPPRIGGPAFLLAGPRSRHPTPSRAHPAVLAHNTLRNTTISPAVLGRPVFPQAGLRVPLAYEPVLRGHYGELSCQVVTCVVRPGLSGVARSDRTCPLAYASSRLRSEVLLKPHLRSRCKGNAGPERRSATRRSLYRSSSRR